MTMDATSRQYALGKRQNEICFLQKHPSLISQQIRNGSGEPSTTKALESLVDLNVHPHSDVSECAWGLICTGCVVRHALVVGGALLG